MVQRTQLVYLNEPTFRRDNEKIRDGRIREVVISFLDAQAATLRIFDPNQPGMIGTLNCTKPVYLDDLKAVYHEDQKNPGQYIKDDQLPSMLKTCRTSR